MADTPCKRLSNENVEIALNVNDSTSRNIASGWVKEDVPNLSFTLIPGTWLLQLHTNFDFSTNNNIWFYVFCGTDTIYETNFNRVCTGVYGVVNTSIPVHVDANTTVKISMSSGTAQTYKIHDFYIKKLRL